MPEGVKGGTTTEDGNGRALHKVYVAVFTCMASRSVHAEVVFKMDVDSIVNALVRFTARRPRLTDRGTNLVATRSILRSELRRLNEEVAPELRKGYGRGWWAFLRSTWRLHSMEMPSTSILSTQSSWRLKGS